MTESDVTPKQIVRRAEQSPELILQEIESLSIEPFQRALADAMAGAPSVEDIRTFASKYPDRWAQLITQMARLSRYSDQTSVINNVLINIQNLSDSEIEAEIENRLNTITAEAKDVTDEVQSDPDKAD